MEHRIIIFTGDDAKEIGRKEHDSSLISSLPKVGDTVLDKVKLDFQEKENVIEARVWSVEFDYNQFVVKIYAKVVRSA